MKKPKILILGKLPPPYYGPAIGNEIILNSKLNNQFELYHLDTRLNSKIKNIGKYFRYYILAKYTFSGFKSLSRTSY